MTPVEELVTWAQSPEQDLGLGGSLPKALREFHTHIIIVYSNMRYEGPPTARTSRGVTVI